MMANVDAVGNPDDPIASMTKTRTGRVLDLNNIPGLVKLTLIEEGEMTIDSFTSPANITGQKLKALREANRIKMEKVIDRRKKLEEESQSNDKGEYKVGDFITFRGDSYEVYKTRSNAVMIEAILEGETKPKRVWIPKEKVTKG